MRQPDLFSALAPPCAGCAQLDPTPINPGVHYCWGWMTWRGADERVERCGYREQPHIVHTLRRAA